MSIKYKIPLLILGFFLFNILFIGTYYKFVLAENIADGFNGNMQTVEKMSFAIINNIKKEDDYKVVLKNIAKEDNLIIEVQSISGETLYTTGDEKGLNINMSTKNAFTFKEEYLILKVTYPISLKSSSSLNYAFELFISEFIIISLTLLLLTGVIHLYSVGPILRLKKTIQQYKQGVVPNRTKRKDEIGDLQNSFVALTEALDEEKQTQNRIVASISHDIKTPLTSVMGYAEQLKKGNISQERFTKYINTIYAKSQVIKEIVDEFDDYVSIQMQPILRRHEITVSELCNKLIDQYNDELSALSVRFTVDCQCPDSIIFIDEAKMFRVFGNLIGNCIKYDKGLNVEIEISVKRQNEHILFSIMDNGSGVSEEEITKIFEPFYTSDKSRRVAGLGLSICKSIVENHGGKIWAQNMGEHSFSISFILESGH